MFTLRNAVEVAIGRSIPKPNFIGIKMGRNGLSMTRLLDRKAAQALLKEYALESVPVQVVGKGSHEQVLMRSLQQGVVLAGGVVSMATYRSIHEEGGKKAWEGVRVPGHTLINHSFCIAGTVAHVRDFGRCFVVRDSQREDCFGVRGCAMLPASQFEGKLEECYIIRKRGR